MIEYKTEEIRKSISKYHKGEVHLSNVKPIFNKAIKDYKENKLSIHDISGIANHLLYTKFKPN